MSLLAPFYLLGALAVGLPILFHLIRRRPTGAITFSSHMFLQATPPRLTRRSRLENWPLLLMRALALMLLAAAFARPFLRTTATSTSEKRGRRIVLVVDKSASMQRQNLWQSAVLEATKIIDDLNAEDELAIVAFDEEPQVLFSFEQSTQLTTSMRNQTALAAIQGTSPTWFATQMGQAISFAADLVAGQQANDPVISGDVAVDDRNATLILISDMQQGAEIESLQQFTWPKALTLETRRVSVAQTTNAAAQILSESRFAEKSDRIRVRVSNAPDSQSARFTLGYVSSLGSDAETQLPVQVPPGESRVVRMPLPSASVTSLVLQGDDHSFDNQWHLVANEPRPVSLLFIGKSMGDSDSKSPSEESVARNSLLYYLQRVPISNKRVNVTITQVDPADFAAAPPPRTTPLIVIADSVSESATDQLREYAALGGRVLFVLSNSEASKLRATITSISDSSAESFAISEAEIDDYSMLADIRFTHPVFQSMADPKFNDFTKVRFWSHRKIQNVPKAWSVIANFDNGDPALLEHQSGSGRVWVLASGWHPAESQLALSTKFLPLVYSFFGRLSSSTNTQSSFAVGGALPFAPSPTAVVSHPDGKSFSFASANDVRRINEPGIFNFKDNDTTQRFAVNVARSESNTSPLEREVFERFGITLGTPSSALPSESTRRQLRDVELEKQQKIWQWLLVAALGLLALETIWGGLLSRGGTMNSRSKAEAV